MVWELLSSSTWLTVAFEELNDVDEGEFGQVRGVGWRFNRAHVVARFAFDARSNLVEVDVDYVAAKKNYPVTCVSFSLAVLVHFGLLTGRWSVALEPPRHHSLFVARFRLWSERNCKSQGGCRARLCRRRTSRGNAVVWLHFLNIIHSRGSAIP